LFYLWRCWLSNSGKPIKWEQSQSMTKANIHFTNLKKKKKKLARKSACWWRTYYLLMSGRKKKF
jgi:hypothetical protein